ncbi:unnamed protein product [Closterium sp. NIES-64]|nr:unnamed protein product [Closterium sp. NIES-64]
MQQQLLSPKRAPELFAFVGVASLLLIGLLCSSYLQLLPQNCFCPNLENPELSTAAAAAAAAATTTASASSLSRDLASARRHLEISPPCSDYRIRRLVFRRERWRRCEGQSGRSWRR